VSSEPAQQSPYPQPSKPYWTAGKIIALILVVLVVVSAAAAAGVYYYYLNRPTPAGVSSVCSNGATNYPSCNSCSSGQSFVSGTCYNNCTNGATNPPACSNNVCSNGATNYPTCTVFQTTTTITCDPNTVHVNFTQSSCTVTVSDTTIPTGMVGISCTGRPGYTYGDCSTTPPSNTCSLSGVSSTSATCTFSVTATGPEASEIIYANYQGDTTHLSSSGQFALTVTPPPTTVTVTGTASVYGTATAKSIQFVDSQTGVSYLALINSGTYTINLTNFRTYDVIINWTNLGVGGSTTCPSALQLKSYSDTWYANYQC
jgi:hypothetical protein